MLHSFQVNPRFCFTNLYPPQQWAILFPHVPLVLVCAHTSLITIRVLWLLFTAFSSIAISTVNHADSRASLASLDSNPSTTEKSSEKTDNCEKVQLLSVLHMSNTATTSQNALSLTYLYWPFDSQIPRPLSLIGSTLRFDKLDQAETRSLLMCFLHIMKTISHGKWNVFKSI